MTFRTDLFTRRDAIGTELAALTNKSAPEYKQGLYDELARINELLTQAGTTLDSVDSESLERFEVMSRGIT